MSENSMVHKKGDDLVVGTWDLAKGFGIDHRRMRLLIEKYRAKFEELGPITTSGNESKKRKGGVIKEFYLNEQQATFLGTLLKNNERVLNFKIKLTKQFFLQRKLLMHLATNKANHEWIEKRESGKAARRLETDAIKQFVEYAKSQGSKNADRYYTIITKMENQSLLNIEMLKMEIENFRDVVDSFSLSTLQIADVIVAKVIKDCMAQQIYYKEIYKKARDKIEDFALSIGKTPLRLMAEENRMRVEARA